LTGREKKTLIDFAVGKAGDLFKWTTTGIQFVLGIDVSRDNIMGAMDCAAQRYIQYRVKNPKSSFRAVFLNGNSSLNIRTGDAFDTEQCRNVAKSLLGEGPPLSSEEYRLVREKHAIGKQGFHIGSCQFALHYFFVNTATMHQFLRNVSETTRLGGFFVGTCYDGSKVFEELTKTSQILFTRENPESSNDPIRVFQIQKLYTENEFPEDETSLGYKIRVYQDSINQELDEYLVNFGFFQKMMVHYGFDIVPREEAIDKGLPNGTGTFDELFRQLEHEERENKQQSLPQQYGKNPKQNNLYGTAIEMDNPQNEYQKQISFLNRYFIFRKNRDINAECVAKRLTLVDKHVDDADEPTPEPKPTITEKIVLEKPPEKKKRAPRKLKEKVVIA
jgi:hypothetical protein